MAARAGSKRAAEQEESGKGSKSSPSKKKPRPLEQVSKFGGMTEEEVCKMLLPDHLKPGLDIVFVSIALCFIPLLLESISKWAGNEMHGSTGLDGPRKIVRREN